MHHLYVHKTANRFARQRSQRSQWAPYWARRKIDIRATPPPGAFLCTLTPRRQADVLRSVQAHVQDGNVLALSGYRHAVLCSFFGVCCSRALMMRVLFRADYADTHANGFCSHIARYRHKKCKGAFCMYLCTCVNTRLSCAWRGRLQLHLVLSCFIAVYILCIYMEYSIV